MERKKMEFTSHLLNRLLIVSIIILILGVFLGSKVILGKLKTQSNTLVSLKAQSQALSDEQTYLAQAKAEIKKYSVLEQITQSIVPQDKDQAQTVREIVNLAQANGITLSGISFPSSTLGSTTGAPANTSSISLSQLTPVKGISGVYVLPIQVNDSQASGAVSYSNFYSFLTSLEQNRRTSLVTGLSIEPLNNGLITFSLTINEYIKP
jgi:hypothetical protein